MRGLLVLGWRNLWRNRRRTLINLSATGLGLFLVICYHGLIQGVMNDARTQLDDTGMGHVEISPPAWRARRSVSAVLDHPQAMIDQLHIEAIAGPGAEIGARVVARGLASSARGSQGVTLEGVDLAAEAKLASYVRDVRVGALPAQSDDRGALIGEQLAERLKLKVGQKLRVMVQRADGEVGSDVLRVRGIFHAVSAQVSKGTVIVPMSAAANLLGLGDAAHQIVIQLDRADDADRVADLVRAKLGAGVKVVTYGEIIPVLKAMEGLMSKVMFVVAMFVYVLVGLGISNTMLMSIMERTRELGVMQALGTRPRRVVLLILAESFWIATVATAVGLSLGLLVTWLGSEHAILDLTRSLGESFEWGGTVLRSAFHTRFAPLSALADAAGVYVLTLVVGLYPAWRITRLTPAEALRHV